MRKQFKWYISLAFLSFMSMTIVSCGRIDFEFITDEGTESSTGQGHDSETGNQLSDESDGIGDSNGFGDAEDTEVCTETTCNASNDTDSVDITDTFLDSETIDTASDTFILQDSDTVDSETDIYNTDVDTLVDTETADTETADTETADTETADTETLDTDTDTATETDSGVVLPSTCEGMPYTAIFSFDSDTAGWGVSSLESVPLSLSWEASGGTPAADGVCRVDAEPNIENVWFIYPISTTDFSNVVISMRVFVAAGDDVVVKVFVQTGDTFEWADGGEITPLPNTWSCVQLDAAAPSFVSDDYDPAETVQMGLGILGVGPLTVYVDEVRY